MPYKDKGRQKEAQKDWVRQKRGKEGSTDQGSTEMFNGKPRYLYLSDGRVHDRIKDPEAVIPVVLFEGKKNAIPGHIFTKNLRACNENTKWVGKFNRGSFERLRGI